MSLQDEPRTSQALIDSSSSSGPQFFSSAPSWRKLYTIKVQTFHDSIDLRQVFLNDTILEIETSYISSKQHRRLFIKSKNILYHIRNIEGLDCSRISTLRQTANKLIISNDNRVNKYTLREDNKRFIYEGGNKDDCYSYERKTYGLGIYNQRQKKLAFMEIQISVSIQTNWKEISRTIYEAVDEMPIFPGRTSKFNVFTRITVKIRCFLMATNRIE